MDKLTKIFSEQERIPVHGNLQDLRMYRLCWEMFQQ